jgi:hypothetical protein
MVRVRPRRYRLRFMLGCAFLSGPGYGFDLKSVQLNVLNSFLLRLFEFLSRAGWLHNL